MTKTPGQFEPPKLITKAEREAQKAFRKDDAKKAMTEHEIAQKAFSTNRERLKAERLAREAVTGPMLYPAPELPDDTPIDNVRFSTRIRTALAAAGWKTVGEIREASDAALFRSRDSRRTGRAEQLNPPFPGVFVRSRLLATKSCGCIGRPDLGDSKCVS